MLLNAVSAAMHTDTHFGATNDMLLEATYHPDVGDTKNWAEQHFLNFLSLLRANINRDTIFFVVSSEKIESLQR